MGLWLKASLPFVWQSPTRAALLELKLDTRYGGFIKEEYYS
jgi:hypothetical protein